MNKKKMKQTSKSIVLNRIKVFWLFCIEQCFTYLKDFNRAPSPLIVEPTDRTVM